MTRVRVAVIIVLALSASVPSEAAPYVLLGRIHHSSSTQPTQPSASINWDQVGFDSTHAGFNARETTLNASNVSQLEVVWSFAAGAGNTVNDLVEDSGIIYAATSNGTLFAIDAATGSPIWSFATGTGYETNGAPAAVDGGMVFTTCNAASGSEGVCALNAATGTLMWTHTPKGATTYGETAPVVAGKLVYVGECADQCAFVALKEKTGKTAWSSLQPAQNCTLNGSSAPTVQRGLVIVEIGCDGFSSGLALDAKTGSRIWGVDLGGPGVPAGESVSGGIAVFVVSNPGSESSQAAFVVDSKKGLLNFVLGAGGVVTGRTASLAYNAIYAPILGELIACKREPKHGHAQVLFGAPGNPTEAAIANQLVFGVFSGKVGALSAVDGNMAWNSGIATNGASPIVVNGSVVASCSTTSVCLWSLPGSLSRKEHTIRG